MMPLNPPRAAEAFLASLGADETLVSDVLGDLAEEFAERTSWQTRAQARWWYFRQTLTVAPLFLRSWGRNARRADYGAMAVWVMWTTLAVQALTSTVMAVADRIIIAITDVPMSTWMWHFEGVESSIPTMVVWGMVSTFPFVGGAIAARFGRRAPIPTVLACAAAWGSIPFALLGRGAFTATIVGHVAVGVTCTMAGGILSATFRPFTRNADRELGVAGSPS